jgi:hypothetical protein
MVESIVFSAKQQPSVPLSTALLHHKIVLNTQQCKSEALSSFDLLITFKNPIVEFRNHDYTWVDCNRDRIAGPYAPKIIKLANGTFVQPNVNQGFWEVQKNNPKALLWRFNPPNASPLTVYSGKHNERVVAQANQVAAFDTPLALLFTTKTSIEFSRSPKPFAAIACFTDHCDFDTLDNLKRQRAFFKANKIKVTKGFFLNHFSKREDNASFELNQQELAQWTLDGHELAYHSLSQSLKNKPDSFQDFYTFIPPSPKVSTWIDHGFQPYNLSLYQTQGMEDDVFATSLNEKGITTLWNYIDSGTSSEGVINQLNPYDFTLGRFYNGIKNLGFKAKMGVLIKNAIVHFYADERLITKYKSLATHFKQLIYDKKLGVLPQFLANFAGISAPLLKILVFWNQLKSKPYKLAKYTPLVFKHTLEGIDFYIFQTIEMIDFKKSLNPKTIDKLIEEKGVFIAHTYFSVPLSYHTGRMFATEASIDKTVTDNFKYLSAKVGLGEIWNPTLNELVLFLANFEKTVLDVDTNGNSVVVNAASIPFRILNE